MRCLAVHADLDLMRPGALMRTNPETRFSLGLKDYHMMFGVDYARKVIFSHEMILPGDKSLLANYHIATTILRVGVL